MKFAVLMKPINLPKRAKRICAEYVIDVEAANKDLAAIEARKCADLEGFRGYAVSTIKELRA